MQLETHVGSAWEMMINDIDAAKRRVYLQQFIVDAPQTAIGQEVTRALEDARDRGVEVKTIIDAGGSVKLWAAENVKQDSVYTFYGLHKWWPIIKTTKLFRDHRKLLIVDDVVHIGGVVLMERARNWNDLHGRFESAAIVEEAVRRFEANYDQLIKGKNRRSVTEEGDAIIEHRHHDLGGPYYEVLKRRIQHAQREIIFTTPYFAPPHKLQRRLFEAVKRGVEVKILIPEEPDWFVAKVVARHYIDKFIKRGVGVYLFPKMNHAKFARVDDWTAFGSFNLDRLSMKWNYEMGIQVNGEEAKKVRDVVDGWYKKARKATNNDGVLDWKQRLVASALKWFA